MDWTDFTSILRDGITTSLIRFDYSRTERRTGEHIYGLEGDACEGGECAEHGVVAAV